MRISVVTVAFNSAATIGRTLASFAAQTHPDKQLVVIDGGSTDGTLDIVQAAKIDGLVLVSEPDRGIYDAMNKGLRRFDGDAVGFLNSDDVLEDERVLGDVSAALDASDIAYGHLDFVKGGPDGPIVRRWRSTPFRQGAFRRGWMPPHPTVYARRSVVEKVGFFDAAYRIAGDYDWMLRAFELNRFTPALVDRVLVRMMSGGASTRGVRSVIRHNLEALRSRRTWLGAGLVDRALLAKPISKLPQLLSR